jgi:hypothetical protein
MIGARRRAPRSGFVIRHRQISLEHGIDHPPRGLDALVLRKQRGVAAHGIAQQPLVRRLSFAGHMVARSELHRLARIPSPLCLTSAPALMTTSGLRRKRK